MRIIINIKKVTLTRKNYMKTIVSFFYFFNKKDFNKNGQGSSQQVIDKNNQTLDTSKIQQGRRGGDGSKSFDFNRNKKYLNEIFSKKNDHDNSYSELYEKRKIFETINEGDAAVNDSTRQLSLSREKNKCRRILLNNNDSSKN